jgi:hypothetical protein
MGIYQATVNDFWTKQSTGVTKKGWGGYTGRVAKVKASGKIGNIIQSGSLESTAKTID